MDAYLNAAAQRPRCLHGFGGMYVHEFSSRVKGTTARGPCQEVVRLCVCLRFPSGELSVL